MTTRNLKGINGSVAPGIASNYPGDQRNLSQANIVL